MWHPLSCIANSRGGDAFVESRRERRGNSVISLGSGVRSYTRRECCDSSNLAQSFHLLHQKVIMTNQRVALKRHDLFNLINNEGLTSSSEFDESSEMESSLPPSPAPNLKATVHIVGTKNFICVQNANLYFTASEQKVGVLKKCVIQGKEQEVRIACIGGM